MISYISRKPMTVTQVMEALPTWRPWKNDKSEGLTNGTHYANGGEFIASDGKVHVWFDFFNLSGTNGDGAEEFEENLDLVSDCSSGPDLDLFYVLAGEVQRTTPLQEVFDQAGIESREVGVVAVDSGQLLIVDPCRVNELPSYEEMCEVTSKVSAGQARKVDSKDEWEIGAAGVVSNTAYGDDVYPVSQLYVGEQLVGIYIALDGFNLGGSHGIARTMLHREWNLPTIVADSTQNASVGEAPKATTNAPSSQA